MILNLATSVETPPPDAQREWIANWTPVLSKQGFRQSGQAEGVLTYTRRRLPGSALIFIFIPIVGWLILLFYRVDQSFTVSFEPSNPGCLLRLRGNAHMRMVGRFRKSGFQNDESPA